MTPELSRQVAGILHSATATFDERDIIINAMTEVDTYDELPETIKSLLTDLETRKLLTLPESRINPNHSKKDGKFTSKTGGSGSDIIEPSPGPISAEQYTAITPGTAKGAVAARASLNATPAGVQLRETTERWQDDVSEIIKIQEAFLADPNSRKITPRAKADATSFMHAIEKAPVSPPLFRGARISPDEIKGFTKGKNIILPPSSFTTSSRIAGGFAKQASRREVEPVLIRVKNGGRAIPVEVFGKSSYKNEKEWISAGQFTVTGVSKRSDGVHVIDVDHTAMFHW